jgi:hypothetical protein
MTKLPPDKFWNNATLHLPVVKSVDVTVMYISFVFVIANAVLHFVDSYQFTRFTCLMTVCSRKIGRFLRHAAGC